MIAAGSSRVVRAGSQCSLSPASAPSSSTVDHRQALDRRHQMASTRRHAGDLGAAVPQPVSDRLGRKAGEHRHQDGADAQRANDRRHGFGNPRQHGRDAVALVDAEAAQPVADARALPRQLAERDAALGAVGADPVNRGAAFARAAGVAVGDGLGQRDVRLPRPAEVVERDLPVERGARLRVSGFGRGPSCRSVVRDRC